MRHADGSYVNNYEESAKLILATREKSKEFDAFLTVSEKCEGHSIFDLLISPVQRVPVSATCLQARISLILLPMLQRYILLLKALLKVTRACRHRRSSL